METDKKEIEEGIEILAKEVEDDEETVEQQETQNNVEVQHNNDN